MENMGAVLYRGRGKSIYEVIFDLFSFTKYHGAQLGVLLNAVGDKFICFILPN
jgi:hypothetical protein